MPDNPIDRLVRKEVSLGVIREYEPPQDHIGQTFAPLKEVATDDVIFGYLRGLSAGLAPARAEDAEAELASKDDSVAIGRASIIDWSTKDHYSASDVMRWKEAINAMEMLGPDAMPLTFRSQAQDFQAKLARDAMRRRRMLDNRLEWLTMKALDLGAIAYDDGRIKFTVNYGRPSGQQDIAPPSGNLWSSTAADWIADIEAIQQLAVDNYGVRLTRAIYSKKIKRNARKSTQWAAAMTPTGTGNPKYVVPGWSDQAAVDFVSEQTGVTFIEYDSVYRTRPMGSNTTTNNRFTREDYLILLPDPADIDALDDSIGFGATLTSPHPEGNWQPGFYEWEQSTKDPWGHDAGSGIKAFPVFPHLDKTWVVKVL